MSYNSDTGIISAPVSIDDVKQALGESSNDLATLCKSSNINMWAKYKPTNYPAPFPETWYKDRYDNYGISVPSYENLKSVLEAYSISGDTTHNNGYSYDRPSGGSNSPYRLGDFRGYRHNATNQILGFTAPSRVTVGTGVTGSCAYNVTSSTDEDDRVNLSDISTIKDCYFGFALFKSGSPVYFRTESNPISSGNFSVTIGSSSTLGIGTYTAVPFLSTAKYDSSDFPTYVEGTWYPIPSAATCSVVVETAASSISKDLVLTHNTSTNQIILTNKGSVTYRKIYIRLRFTSSKSTTAMQIGEYTAVSNSTIAPGASIYVNLNNYSLLSGKSYKAVLSANGTLVKEIILLSDDFGTDIN